MGTHEVSNLLSEEEEERIIRRLTTMNRAERRAKPVKPPKHASRAVIRDMIRAKQK